MTTVFLINEYYCGCCESVLNENEQSFGIVRSYKKMKVRNAVMDIGQ